MNDDEKCRLQAILASPSYRVAYKDVEFLTGPGLRAVRLELELLKPEMALADHEIRSTIVVFGSTRIADRAKAVQRLQRAQVALAASPGDVRLGREVARAERLAARVHYYEAARRFGALVSAKSSQNGWDYVIMTGGGPGIMEAANRGAYEAGGKSIGLNIKLPAEQQPNTYITPELCFQFHYFAMRKLHFVLRAKALVVFPGGFGTLDELFEVLTLSQTGRMQKIPIILFGREYWEKLIDFEFLADEGTIEDDDLKLFSYVETPEEAWEIIRRFHDGE
ncbi:MAG: LOG family protein [Pirellulales bacterium]|jgi:uncharacterized protein (TIGR00730 family)